MDSKTISASARLDYMGIALASICGLHCLITPLLVVFLPQVGEAFSSPITHILLSFLIFFAFYHTIYKHYFLHRSKRTLAFGLVGLSLLMVSLIIEVFSHHKHSTHEIESHLHLEPSAMIAILGGSFMIFAHYLNLKKCKCLSGKGLCS